MYDAIVIGARCAGAPTAMLLAREGHRVLLVDQSTFPSDQVMSTHLIWQPGVERLQRWGLLPDVVATGCPPIADGLLDLGAVTLGGRIPPADGARAAYSPRRYLLDAILVEAAVAAGAELREGCVLQDLLYDDERVSGIRARSRDGGAFTEKAAIVIGADGPRSKVARLVRAPASRGMPALQGTYFTYWSGVDVERFQVAPREHRCVYAWMTNDGLALVGVNWAAADFPAVRGNVERSYLDVLHDVTPDLAQRVRAGGRESRFIGGTTPNYVRKPYGPGWALVGDAGYLKDPCTAQGITDAFRDAELLCQAVDSAVAERQDWEDALAGYERERDTAALAMYEFTCAMAGFETPPPETQQLFAALAGNQAQTDRFLGVFAGTVPIEEFFAPANLQQIAERASAASPS